MAVHPIVVWPDPRLRVETQSVGEITDEIRTLYRNLCDTMYAHNGVGIASVQIGVPIKMFIVEAAIGGGEETDEPWVFINPEILETSDEVENSDEGCLSFPGIYIPIERPIRAKIRAMNIKGEIFEAEGEGLFARAIQHEFDHLSGKLMVDFVGPLKKQMIKRRLKRDGAYDDAAPAPDSAASS